MDVERETLVQAGVGAAAVLVFVVLVAVVGTVYDAGGFDRSGALALVGVIVFFVVLLTVLGMAFGNRWED